MNTITALRSGKRSKNQVSLFLDGKFAFSIERDRAAQEKLKVGLALSEDRLNVLMDSNRLDRCLNAAYRLLSYRSRSEAELRDRLQRRGFRKEHIEQTVSRLKERGLLDDFAFAKFWAENRATFRPRSREMTRRELKKKGVAEEVISQAVEEIDETESAYRAASARADRILPLDYSEYRRLLWDFLRRRGFSYQTINRTIRRVWEEKAS